MGSWEPKCFVESGPPGSIEIPIVIAGKTSIKAVDCVNHFHLRLLVPAWFINNLYFVGLLGDTSDTFKASKIQSHTLGLWVGSEVFSKFFLVPTCISKYISTAKASTL